MVTQGIMLCHWFATDYEFSTLCGVVGKVTVWLKDCKTEDWVRPQWLGPAERQTGSNLPKPDAPQREARHWFFTDPPRQGDQVRPCSMALSWFSVRLVRGWLFGLESGETEVIPSVCVKYVSSICQVSAKFCDRAWKDSFLVVVQCF